MLGIERRCPWRLAPRGQCPAEGVFVGRPRSALTRVIAATRMAHDKTERCEPGARGATRLACAAEVSAGPIWGSKASELRESYLSDVPRAHGEAPEQVGQSHEEEMTKLIWRITGYLGDKSVYERAVRKGALSQKAMIALLQRLASRHLSEDDVVCSSLKQDDRDYCSALEIRNCGSRDALMTTGSGHYYTALAEKAETKPPTRRRLRWLG
jgi:hypothetical protein